MAALYWELETLPITELLGSTTSEQLFFDSYCIPETIFWQFFVQGNLKVFSCYSKYFICHCRSTESEATSNRSLTSAKISEVKASVKSLQSSANDNRKDIGKQALDTYGYCDNYVMCPLKATFNMKLFNCVFEVSTLSDSRKRFVDHPKYI